MDYLSSLGQATDVKQLALNTATVFVAGGVLYVLARAFYNLFLSPLRSFPGPWLHRISHIPLECMIFQGRIVTGIAELHDRYGPVVRTAPDEVSHADGRVWKDVWDHRPEFPKDPKKAHLPPNGLPNILTADKPAHSRHRRLLSHAFSDKGLREQAPRIQQYIELLIARLRENADTGEATDMVQWYTMTVFDVICDLAWGESFHCLRDRQVHEWIVAILGSLKFTVQASIFQRRGLSILVPFIMSKGLIAQLKKNFALVAEMVDKRLEKGSYARGDFWDRVLVKSADNNAGGEGMSKGEILNNASILTLAGAETSTTALSGATFLLLTHPEKLKRLVHEIRTSFKSAEEIDAISVNRLRYMLAVLDETLRLYPPVPHPAPRNPPPGGGMVCGRWLPEDTVIRVSNRAMGRSKENFHRPDEFVPERWLDEAPPEFANDRRAALQPFASGVRNCIGRGLAYSEMRLIFAKVFYNFDLHLDAERTGNWMDQKAWGVVFKGPIWVSLTEAKH